MNHMRRIIITLIASLAVLATTGCDIVVIGDSVIHGDTERAIRVSLNDDPANPTDVWVDAAIGRGPFQAPYPRSTTIQGAVRDLAPTIPHEGILVIQDGGIENPNEWEPLMQWVNDFVRADICIVWVYPYQAMHDEASDRVRAIIDQYKGGHRHVTADWAAIASTDPVLYVADGIHPGPEGQLAFGAMLANAVEECA